MLFNRLSLDAKEASSNCSSGSPRKSKTTEPPKFKLQHHKIFLLKYTNPSLPGIASQAATESGLPGNNECSCCRLQLTATDQTFRIFSFASVGFLNLPQYQIRTFQMVVAFKICRKKVPTSVEKSPEPKKRTAFKPYQTELVSKLQTRRLIV